MYLYPCFFSQCFSPFLHVCLSAHIYLWQLQDTLFHFYFSILCPLFPHLPAFLFWNEHLRPNLKYESFFDSLPHLLIHVFIFYFSRPAQSRPCSIFQLPLTLPARAQPPHSAGPYFCLLIPPSQHPLYLNFFLFIHFLLLFTLFQYSS